MRGREYEVWEGIRDFMEKIGVYWWRGQDDGVVGMDLLILWWMIRFCYFLLRVARDGAVLIMCGVDVGFNCC
jgi:hypothetical protein